MRFLTLSILTVIAVGCLKKAPSVSGIRVGLGQETTDYPAIVKIVSSNPGPKRSLCSGTFIAANIMVTAWHCIQDKVTGGLEYVDQAGQVHRSIRVLLPEPALYPKVTVETDKGPIVKADPGAMRRDLAILIFDKNLRAPAIMPIGARPPSGAEVQIIGFGQTGFDDAKKADSSGVKRLGHAPVRDSNVILLDDNNHQIDTTGVIMTGGDGAYIQPGDSGGAMVYEVSKAGEPPQAYLVGVSSHGPTTADFLMSFFVDLSSGDSRKLLAQVDVEQLPATAGASPAAVQPSGPPTVLKVNCFCAFYESNCVVFAEGDEVARAWKPTADPDQCNQLACGEMAKAKVLETPGVHVNERASVSLDMCGYDATCVNGDCKLREDQLPR